MLHYSNRCDVTKLLGYRRKSKAPNKMLRLPIKLKTMIKIIIQET